MQIDTIYDSSKRRPAAIEELVNAWIYRDLILQLVRRDITTRYKRSVLGIAWTMLNPLGTMIIMTIVFSNFFHRQEFFSVYLLSGLMSWNFFAQTTVSIIQGLTWGQDLFQRIYIPRSSFAIAAVGTGIVNFVLTIIPLLLVKLVIGSPISWHVLLFPIQIVFLAAFSLGMGLIISSFALYFQDISDIYGVLLTGWFYLTPIIYPIDSLPANMRFALAFNPMLYCVQLMRDFFYTNVSPTPGELLIVFTLSFTTLIIGWLLFARQTEEFVLRT